MVAARGNLVSAVAGIVEYFLYPLLMFAATPFFLRWLGTDQYGQWMMIVALTGLGGLVGLGMGAATVREVAVARINGADWTPSDVVWSSITLTVASCFVVGVLIYAGVTILSLDSLTSVAGMQAIRGVLHFGVWLLVLEQFDGIFAGALRGAERFVLAAGIEAVAKTATVFVALACAWYWRDLSAVMVGVISITVARLLLKLWWVYRVLGGAVWLPRYDIRLASRLFAFGKWMWLMSVGGVLFSVADRLLVGSMLGSAALTSYSVAIQLAQQIQAVPAAAAGFVFPRVANDVAANRNYSASLLGIGAAIALLASTLGAVLMIWGQPLLVWWLGPSVGLSASDNMTPLALAYVMLAFATVPHFALLGAGASRYLAASNSIAGLIGICATYFLIPHLGLLGAISGRFFFAGLVLFHYPVLVYALRKKRM